MARKLDVLPRDDSDPPPSAGLHLGDPAADLLWILSELDNIDKHRVLLIVNPKLTDAQLNVTVGDETKTYTVSNHPQWTSLKLGAIPFRLSVTGPPETKVKGRKIALSGNAERGRARFRLESVDPYPVYGYKIEGEKVSPFVMRYADTREKQWVSLTTCKRGK